MEAMKRVNVAQIVDGRPLGSFQMMVVVLCTLVIFFDGLNLGTISTAAPVIAHAIHASVHTFGPIFSAGFVGIFIGALLFGTVADRAGRKATVIAGTLTFGIFTLPHCSYTTT